MTTTFGTVIPVTITNPTTTFTSSFTSTITTRITGTSYTGTPTDSAASTTTTGSDGDGPVPTQKPGSYHHKIVLTATIGGALVLVLTVLFCVFRIKRWMKARQRGYEHSYARYSRSDKGHNSGNKRKHGRYMRPAREWDALDADGIPA
ncbi:hypothetical protein DL93DRAFT_2072789 [Clavulina sp. PMI_390]|nr:hypothetical protein DL93DRAFT_2072789 [Clavulina sp. PMI_390]